MGWTPIPNPGTYLFMNVRLWLSPWACALTLVLGLGCSSSAPPNYYTSTGDGGSSPGVDVPSSATCSPGQVYCSGNDSYECDSSGNVINRMACPTSAPNCFPGHGCLECNPSTSRCNPTNAQQIQTCRTDGSGWVDGAVCNSSSGSMCNGGVCTDRCTMAAQLHSYLGCSYWPTVTVNSQLDAMFQFAVVMSNPQTYSIAVTITGGALTAPMSLTLAPGQVQVQVLPWVDELIEFNRSNPGCMSDGTVDGVNPCASNTPGVSVMRPGGAYHIQTNGPIAAYQFNPLTFERAGGFYSFTNDASLLLPQNVLTNHYLISTYPNWNADGMGTYLGGFIAIVAVTGESTHVSVRPTAAITASADGHVTAGAAGSMQTYALQAGDVVQLVSTGAGDLTGTVISSDLPVAVFVGHDCTYVPQNRPACDHLEQQLLPNETWGRDYVVSALRDRGPTEASVIRVVSQADGNAITFDPPSTHPGVTLGAGQLLEFAVTTDFHITGSKAFLVTQYMIGQGSAMSGPSTGGDPAMVLEVPSQQYRTSYDFYVPSTYTGNFINIVAPTGAHLTMDATPVAGSSSNVGNWTIYHLPIAAGAHHIQSSGGSGFGIKVYGIAQYTSYMYPGGLDLAQISPG